MSRFVHQRDNGGRNLRRSQWVLPGSFNVGWKIVQAAKETQAASCCHAILLSGRYDGQELQEA